jgi:hypothetical protein
MATILMKMTPLSRVMKARSWQERMREIRMPTRTEKYQEHSLHFLG